MFFSKSLIISGAFSISIRQLQIYATEIGFLQYYWWKKDFTVFHLHGDPAEIDPGGFGTFHGEQFACLVRM